VDQLLTLARTACRHDHAKHLNAYMSTCDWNLKNMHAVVDQLTLARAAHRHDNAKHIHASILYLHRSAAAAWTASCVMMVLAVHRGPAVEEVVAAEAPLMSLQQLREGHG